MNPAPRLNKIISAQLGIGRRGSDLLIEQGRVLVNGRPAVLGQRLEANDKVAVNGKTLDWRQAPAAVYLMLHKPVGYVCSRRQQGSTPTIYALLPQKYRHLQPVGRLDRDSSGLLLLTNDGDFALRMTHPRFGKRKAYEVQLGTPLQPLHQQMISDMGVQLPDGPSRLQLERLRDGNATGWRVLMHEGRNRQIRRTFAALGYEVAALHRTAFGDFALGSLAPGAWQEVTPQR